MTLCATFAYSTILINRLLATTLTFCIGLCSEGIVFLTCKFILAKPIQLITPELQIFPLIILACAIVQFALTLGLCKIVEIYRRKPPSIYTTILLVISFLGILAIEMFVTFAETKYLPTAIITIVLVIVCIALCAGLFRDQLRIQEDRIRLGFLNKQVDDQIEQYKKVQLHNEDICQIEHDLKNYIINAKTLLEQKEYDRLNSLLSKLDSKIRPRLLVNTGNMEIDSVLSAKRTQAPDIPFRISIVPLKFNRIDPMDVAMILSGAVDNAIEGCEGHPDPYIDVRIQIQGSMISIVIKNPTNHKILKKHNQLITQKKNPERHGYGIRGMKRLVGNYDGHLTWEYENGIFGLNVLLQDV